MKKPIWRGGGGRWDEKKPDEKNPTKINRGDYSPTALLGVVTKMTSHQPVHSHGVVFFTNIYFNSNFVDFGSCLASNTHGTNNNLKFEILVSI